MIAEITTAFHQTVMLISSLPWYSKVLICFFTFIAYLWISEGFPLESAA
jgi:hypothetical protein